MIDNITPSEIVETVRESLVVLRDDLTVEYASPRFYTLFGVNEVDTLGRKIFDLGDGQWDIPALNRQLTAILPEATSIEAFDIDHDFPGIGRRVMRLNARKTVRKGNHSRRILLAIEDVTQAYDHERELGRQRRLAQGIVDTIREPLLVLDGDLKIISASRAFYRTFETKEAHTLGHRLPELGNGQWNVPELIDLLARVIPDNGHVEDYLIEHEFQTIGRRAMLLNASKMFRQGNKTRTLLLAIEDITDRRRLEAQREDALRQSRMLMDELNHRVMNSLSLIGTIMGMEARNMSDDQCKAAFGRVRARVQAVGDLYKTLSHGGDIDSVDASVYLESVAQDVIRSVGDAQGVAVELQCDIAAVRLPSKTALPLALVLNEAVTNSIKYAFTPDRKGARIRVVLEADTKRLTLSIEDNGSGTPADTMADSGLGGRLIDAFSRQLGGTIERSSGPGGTLITLGFPNRDNSVNEIAADGAITT